MKQFSKIILAVLLVLGSCTSSRITSTWKATDQPKKNFKKVLVLGLLLEKDRGLREKMEDHIVNDLKTLGYQAVCSCDEFSPKVFENMNEATALEKLSGGGIDAVLTVVLLDKTRERYYVPGKVNYTPYNVYQRHWWGYYSTMHDRIFEPDYYAESTKFFWESNLYDLNTKKLLYSVQTQSFDPSTAESLAHEYGKLIVNDMIKSGVISNQKLLASPLKPM
jgi:hypothetical protein